MQVNYLRKSGDNMYKKPMLIISLSFYMAVLLLTSFMGTAVGSPGVQPGSQEDPLVTRSYVDRYIDERVAPFEDAIQNLTNQVTQLEVAVNNLQENLGPSIRLVIDNRTAHIGMTAYTLDVAPFMVDGRTMVPFRFIGEALGAEVDWDPVTRTVFYVTGNMRMEIPIGSTTIMINGEARVVDASASLVDGRTLVPVRIVSEQLGARVNWNPVTRQVTILPLN